MPKKVRYHANERVDLLDLVRSSNDYTSEYLAFNVERSWLDNRSRILEGFRVELADQAANPGQFTIHNGSALDRDGVTINNEESVTTAKTYTLPGASATYYVEIEFVESDSDTDARAFWDPTFDNGTDPDGKEFAVNAATRITPDWQIVTPVSTSAFSIDADPNSRRIPVAVLETNASTEIAGPIGLIPVQAASVLEEDTDIATTADRIRVLNSRLFNVGDDITVDFGGAGAETVTITSNDTTNGIVQFTPAMAVDHEAGAIVKVSSGTGRFLRERKAASPAAGAADWRRGMFQGDEVRGTALVQDKDTFGKRDDWNVQGLKDYVDFLAAQVRDIKWGATRPGTQSPGAPTSFDVNARYFESAGGLQGARVVTVSIGNGSTSYGDFNGTDEQPFIDAVAALPASGGRIFVKRGTYDFTDAVTIAAPVELVGEGSEVTTLRQTNTTAGTPLFIFTGISATSRLSDLNLRLFGASPNVHVLELGSTELHIDRCYVSGTVETLNTSARLRVYSTEFNSGLAASSATALDASAGLGKSVFMDCLFAAANGLAINFGASNNVAFFNCRFDSDNSVAFTTGTSNEVSFQDCEFSPVTGKAVDIQAAAEVNGLHFDACSFETNAATGPVVDLLSATTSSRLYITNCTFYGTFSGTTSGAPAAFVKAQADIDGFKMQGCTLTASVGEFVTGLEVIPSMSVNGSVGSCSFINTYRGVHNRGGDVDFTISGNRFTSTGQNMSQSCLYLEDGDGHVRFVHNFADFGSSDTSSGAKRVVELSGGTGYYSGLVVSDNTVGYVGNTTSTGSGGNSVTHISSTAQIASVVIANNTIRSVRNVGDAANGFYVSPGYAESVVISGNSMENIGAVSDQAAYGVYLSGAIDQVSVTCSMFAARTTASAPVSAVYVSAGTRVLIADNTLIAQTTGTSPIRSGVQLDTNKASVIGNTIRCGSGCLYGIRVVNDASGSVLSNNTIFMNSDSAAGVSVLEGVSASHRVSISDNYITGLSIVGSNGWGIFLQSSGKGLRVENNTIEETVYADTHKGIYISNGVQVTVSGNVVTSDHGSAGSSFDRDDILLNNISGLVVNGNMLRMSDTDTSSYGNGIQLTDCTGFSVVGNTVMTGDGLLVSILLSASSTPGLVVANAVANLVEPDPPTAGVTYANNTDI